MRFKVPVADDTRKRKSFAWLPTEAYDSENNLVKVWLEPITIHQIYEYLFFDDEVFGGYWKTYIITTHDYKGGHRYD